MLRRHPGQLAVSPWIRSARWDGFWVLSGLPLGLALTCLARFGPPGMPIKVIAALFLANGHALAPILAAWGNAGFRARMRARLWKYVGWPCALLLGATTVGICTSLFMPTYRPGLIADLQVYDLGHDYLNPFALVAVIYLFWNAYHFGMQNFGVLSLYRRNLPRCSRRVDRCYACATTWATMAMPLVPALAHASHDTLGWPAHAYPFLSYAQDGYLLAALSLGGPMVAHELANGSLPRVIFSATLALGMVATFWVGPWAFAVVLVNHWLVAIGLASRVHAAGNRRAFVFAAVGLIFAGAVLFAALFLRPDLGMRVAAWAVGFRIGLGFVHFLYDRWIYRFTDPVVMGTVGLALFA
jgi:hypothetical protein